MSSNNVHTNIENSDGGSYDEKMEFRLYKIENDVVSLKIDLAVIRSNYATKADLQQALHELRWKMYGFATLLVGVVYFLDHHVR